MTPLAFDLMRDLTTPGAFRAHIGQRRMFWNAVMQAHFFDL
jgi:hypothetical protein